MAKNFYTKCGKCFSKSSTAVVTRFEDLNQYCEGCKFIENASTVRGGKDVKISFCQSGSKKPSNITEYTTTNIDDSTTLSIISINMDVLKEIYEYAYNLEGFINTAIWPKVFHGLDHDDCRKSMPLYFEQNKKGKTVKKSIIEKYFSNNKKLRIWTTEESLQDEATKKELPGEMEYKAKCPYLSSVGDKYIQCCLHAKHRGRPEFPSQEAISTHTDNICYGNFDKCDIYQAAYKEEMASKDKYILDFRKCAFCCNNSGYTGLKNNDGSTHCFCQLWKEEKENFNEDTICEWFNKKYRPQESRKEIISAQKTVRNLPCPYYGGVSPEGRKFKIKCGKNHYLVIEDEIKLQEHIEYCKSGYKSCRSYTRCELSRLGIDLGPASPQKTEHLFVLIGLNQISKLI